MSGSGTAATSADDLLVFERLRPRLLGLAYRMLGVVADAEDVVQDTWLRWHHAERAAIERPEAWLTTVTCRLALDRLKSARQHREHYVGPWLPEPVSVEASPEEAAELADSLTYGFLVMLDELSPLERAVLLMADVFGFSFVEVAEAVGKSEAACRQTASRARRRLHHDHPSPVPGADRQVVDGFLAAIALGDVEGALERVAPEVVLTTDGGPTRRAARHPVVGADRVVRFLSNLAARQEGTVEVEPMTVNHAPGVVVKVDGEVDFVAAFGVHDDRIRTMWLVRNPDKLHHSNERLRLV